MNIKHLYLSGPPSPEETSSELYKGHSDKHLLPLCIRAASSAVHSVVLLFRRLLIGPELK